MGDEAVLDRDDLVALGPAQPGHDRRPRPGAAWCGSPTARASGPAVTTGSSMRPRRRRASATRSTLARTWALGSRVWRSQPPQPSATCGQRGLTRSGEAHSRRRTTPRRAPLRWTSSTSTCSPGRAPATSTTRPSGWRARASPPATRRSATRATVSPRPRSGRRSRGPVAGGWSASDGGRSVTSPTVGGYRPNALSLVREGSHVADRAPLRRDRPLRAPRRLRPPRRCRHRPREGRRRPHPVGRHGRQLRAEPHLRRRRHRRHPTARRGPVRGPPDGDRAHLDPRDHGRGGLSAPDRPRRGLPAPAPHARPHPRARRRRRGGPQPRHAGRGGRPTCSTWSRWCW